jgi:hypothetical protein
MTDKRRGLIEALQSKMGTKLLVYVTGDRRGLETVIAGDTIGLFTHHLDAIGDVPKLSLFLCTRGGDTLSAWSIANLIRQFCTVFEIIVPTTAHSSGTLMCLAADSIVMTKQATLGPIDPSVNTPLNPAVPGAPPPVKAPVSVEDIGGYIDFARSVSNSPENLSQALALLAQSVHPLVLGKAFRARSQIRMLAKKLMGDRFEPKEHAEKILGFLCSESGSHDYTINRREARGELGLPVRKPDVDEYALIQELYDDIATELELATPYDPNSVLGPAPTANYSFHRAVLESMNGGKHTFISEGTLTRQQIQTPQGPQIGLLDQRSFEGWRHADE